MPNHISRLPVVVSLFTSDDYYAASARRLREDCETLRIDHDIVEIDKSEGEDWLAICRRKVPFYIEMQRKHRRPIFWLDVDSRLASWPAVLSGLTSDVAGFLRGLKYLRDFDPVSAPRFFAPFALYFNYTPQTTAFLECMADLESSFSGLATDDYFLHEAWLNHGQQMSVTVLPPGLVGDEWPLPDGCAIQVGISGNVTSFRARAAQHTAAGLAPERRKAVLLHEAAGARRAGRIDDAIVLYRHALEAGPPDESLAGKIARLMRRQGMKAEAARLLEELEARSSAGAGEQAVNERKSWFRSR